MLACDCNQIQRLPDTLPYLVSLVMLSGMCQGCLYRSLIGYTELLAHRLNHVYNLVFLFHTHTHQQLLTPCTSLTIPLPISLWQWLAQPPRRPWKISAPAGVGVLPQQCHRGPPVEPGPQHLLDQVRRLVQPDQRPAGTDAAGGRAVGVFGRAEPVGECAPCSASGKTGCRMVPLHASWHLKS